MRLLRISISLTILLLFSAAHASAQYRDRRKDRDVRAFQSFYIGVPLVGGAFVQMIHDSKMAQLRNDYVPHFHAEIDNYLQYSPAVLMVGMKAAGLRSRSNWGEMLLADASSYAIMGAVVNSLKYSAKVMRPDGSRANSFPSGHSATAFMTATMLHKEYGSLSPWISVAAYTAATGTGVMRVLNNRHWLSDVMAGAGIGIISTELGYWISDSVFGKGNVDRDFRDFWREYEPSDPSFVGMVVGYSIPLSRHRITDVVDVESSTGSMAGFEGAWFMNRNIGLGARAVLTNIFYSLDAPVPVSDTYRYHTLQAGVYGQHTLYKHMYIGEKLLGGYTCYSAIDTPVLRSKAGGGPGVTAGLRAGVRVNELLDVCFSGDLNVLPPHRAFTDDMMTTVSFGTTVAVRIPQTRH